MVIFSNFDAFSEYIDFKFLIKIEKKYQTRIFIRSYRAARKRRLKQFASKFTDYEEEDSEAMKQVINWKHFLG